MLGLGTLKCSLIQKVNTKSMPTASAGAALERIERILVIRVIRVRRGRPPHACASLRFRPKARKARAGGILPTRCSRALLFRPRARAGPLVATRAPPLDEEASDRADSCPDRKAEPFLLNKLALRRQGEKKGSS